MNIKRLVGALALAILSFQGCGGEATRSSAPKAPQPQLETPLLWGNLTPGDYWVGFDSRWLADERRPLEDGSPRPIQASVWYPAEPYPGAAPLRYRDYVALAASELGNGPATDEAVEAEVLDFLSKLERADVPSDAAEKLLNTELAARPDIEPAGGEFPLVILAQGHGNSPHRQTVMCEYLASHGFVVITMPSQGRISGFPETEEEVLPKIEEQAEDLAFLVSHRAELSPVSTDGVGVIGYSFGARSALAFQLRTGGADALVSVDGGIGNGQGKEILQDASWFEPEKANVPLLHVYQPGDAVVAPDFEVIESLVNSERILVRVGGLKHGHFSNSGMLRTLGDGWNGVIAADLDPQPAFEETLRTIRAFLRANLEDDPLELKSILDAGATGAIEEVRSLASGAE